MQPCASKVAAVGGHLWLSTGMEDASRSPAPGILSVLVFCEGGSRTQRESQALQDMRLREIKAG